ncbi:MAG: S41 family peptidase, partial [Terriglobales bacterium]
VEAVVSKRVGYANVVDVQPGGAAAQAGLERGDFLEAIDEAGTRDLSLEEIHRRLRGTVGSEVTLSVVHLHQSDPVKVTIKRVAPKMAPLVTRMDGGVGVIQVPGFEAGRSPQLAAAVKSLDGAGAKALVLDLRNCGSGSYSEAEQSANLFLNQGTITYLEGQKFPRETANAEAAKAVDASGKLEVLVNFGTSGPCEVAAAALQGNGRAQLIGDRTFGEGSVQKLIPVGDGSAVWLSVARYYTPKGKLVQDGLTPDVLQVQYAGALPDLDYRPLGVSGQQADLQMEKALALAQGAGTGDRE